MYVSQSPPHPVGPVQISMPSSPGAAAGMPECGEDGCTVPRSPLRISNRGVWYAVIILTAATGWLMG